MQGQAGYVGQCGRVGHGLECRELNMKRLVFGIGVLCFLMIGSPVMADPVVISFSGSSSGEGTLDFDGTNVTGNHILIDELIATGGTTPTTAAVIGYLNFDTQEGTIALYGIIPSLGITDGHAPVLLAEGSITGFTWNETDGIPMGSFWAQGLDTKAADLLLALGVPSDTQFGFHTVSVGFQKVENGSYVVTSAAFVNCAIVVAEPQTLLLLGAGLLVVGLVRSFQKAMSS